MEAAGNSNKDTDWVGVTPRMHTDEMICEMWTYAPSHRDHGGGSLGIRARMDGHARKGG